MRTHTYGHALLLHPASYGSLDGVDFFPTRRSADLSLGPAVRQAVRGRDEPSRHDPARCQPFDGLAWRAGAPRQAIERLASSRIMARRFVPSSNCLTNSRSEREIGRAACREKVDTVERAVACGMKKERMSVGVGAH